MSTELEFTEEFEELREKIDCTSFLVLLEKQKHYTGADPAKRFIHFYAQQEVFDNYFSNIYSNSPVLRSIQWDIMKHLASIDLLLSGTGELTEANVMEKIGDATNYFRLAMGALAEVEDSMQFSFNLNLFNNAHALFMTRSNKLIEKLIENTHGASKSVAPTSFTDGLKSVFNRDYSKNPIDKVNVSGTK